MPAKTSKPGAVDGRRVEQLKLLAHVASKALDAGNGSDAERLLATAIADCVDFAEHAAPEEVDLVGEIHQILAPLLPRLEAVTGNAWTRHLAVFKIAAWKPRGRA